MPTIVVEGSQHVMPPTTDQRITEDDPLLRGDGVVAGMIRGRDWVDHPLGPPSAWPPGLRVALGLVLNSPESMILAWGPELHFFCNDAYVSLLGPRAGWALGERFERVWADAWEQAGPIVDDALNGRPARFVDLPWTMGADREALRTWWSLSCSRVLDETGEVAGLFILTNETTQRVLADAALATSRRDLDRAIGEVRALNAELERQVSERTAQRDRIWTLSPDLFIVIGPEGLCRRVNPAWTAILGYSQDELIGRRMIDLVHPDDVSASELALAMTKSDPLPVFETRLRHKDGSYRWIAWVTAPGKTEIFAVGRHVTAAKEAEAALRRAEDQLRQAHKVEAVGQLTGGVAHDFNNLLTVIRGSVDLLRRPGLSDARRERYIDAIAQTADRATRLTGQLLAFARRQALKPEVFDVGASLRAVMPMIETLGGARMRLALELPELPCFIRADRSQFDTAIVNMAVNARDAMAGEGLFSIRVDGTDRIPAARAHPPIEGSFVAVTLTDTGTGIAPDRIDHIFEPFFTTKGVGEGTGLGLSQVFGFAKQSGGEIVVTSREGEGAAFTLYFERASEPLPSTPKPEEDIRVAFGADACVLVVEDNPDVGTFATRALVELGYRATMAVDGACALAELERRGDAIDVVFTDVVMPGMSGVELAQAIRSRWPAMPVILTSGYSTALAESGTHGFELLRKPYSVEELSTVLRRAARQGSGC